MSQFKSRITALARLEIPLVLMVVLSLVCLLAPRNWLNVNEEVDLQNWKAILYDDQWSGGNSKVSWLDEGKQQWKCEIGDAVATPYCTLHINLVDENGDGLDLSRFTTMDISVDYEGPAEHLRFYLRNHEPQFQKQGEIAATKYNVVELPISEIHALSFDLDRFKVADWWLASYSIPLEESQAEFNDVISLELQTGSLVKGGTHIISLKKLAFAGPSISEEVLYRGLLFAWVIFIAIILAVRFIRLKMELKKEKATKEQLVSINRVLNLQNKRFEDLAKTDQLTGLLNRIGIRETLYDCMSNWNAKMEPSSFVLLDIDHFKSINDTYGHDVGDEVLKKVGELLKRSVRQSDAIARWGGEEFILICPATSLEQAKGVAEQLRAKLEQEPMHPEFSITGSFGVATMVSNDLDHVFKNADIALYEAKNNGRNRVESIS